MMGRVACCLPAALEVKRKVEAIDSVALPRAPTRAREATLPDRKAENSIFSDDDLGSSHVSKLE